MKFNVPQYIDKEDKIAFMLTAKQLGWFSIGGIILFILWNFVNQGVFYFWAIIIGLASCAMAFYKPHGLTLAAFIKYAFIHFLKPKLYVWRIEPSLSKNYSRKNENKESSNKKNEVKPKEKPKNLSEIVKILDS